MTTKENEMGGINRLGDKMLPCVWTGKDGKRVTREEAVAGMGEKSVAIIEEAGGGGGGERFHFSPEIPLSADKKRIKELEEELAALKVRFEDLRQEAIKARW